MPHEYIPWLRDLVPLTQNMMKAFDKKRFNRNENHEARILLILFFCGVVEYYQKAKSLTFGQHRYLAIKVLEHIGFNYETASYVFDRTGELSKYFPELVTDGADAIDAGFRCGREYFEHGDERVFIMPKFKELQWSEKGWLKS